MLVRSMEVNLAILRYTREVTTVSLYSGAPGDAIKQRLPQVLRGYQINNAKFVPGIPNSYGHISSGDNQTCSR